MQAQRFDTHGQTVLALTTMLDKLLPKCYLFPYRIPAMQNGKQHEWIQRGGGVGPGGQDPPPLKNHKNIGFLSNTGSDPLENHKATKPAFNVGPPSAPQQNAI